MDHGLFDIVGDVWSDDVSIEEDLESSWVVGVVGVGEGDLGGPDGHVVGLDHDDLGGFGAAGGGGRTEDGVGGVGEDLDVVGLAECGVVFLLEVDGHVVELVLLGALLVEGDQFVLVSVHVDEYVGGVVADNFVGVHVSPRAFGEDPGVVQHGCDVLVVGGVGRSLNK